MTTLGF